jgi:hypothetical protein
LLVVAAITSTVYLARIWARLFVAKNAGLDDLLMSIAMVPLLGLTVAVVLGAFSSLTFSDPSSLCLRSSLKQDMDQLS